jgi:hypothetical protein
VRVSREALAEVRAKYAEMLEMRLEHEARDGSEDAARVRVRMGALASRFPGALRELDALPLGEIRRRVAALDAVVAGAGQDEPWMEAVTLFHALARGALVAKRWLAGRKVIDASVRRELDAAADALPFAADARVWIADLERLASPPAGRLTDLVYARLAETLGTSASEARRRVFGPP